jgi:hypothetical protein
VRSPTSRSDRSATVDRKLIFVEPDPAVAGAGGAAARDWNALAVTQVAVLGIPRNEAIRSDIQSVIVRNRAIERVREIVRLVGNEGDERAKVRAVATEVPSAAWGAKWLSETIRDGDWGPSYGLYHRLKVRGVVDYLAELVVRAAGLDPDSDDLVAAHYLVRAWKEGGYAEEPEGAKQPENQLLLQFSHPYRWRRVAFVIQKVKQLRSRDPAVVKEVFTGCGLERHEVDRSELASIVEALMPRLSRAQEVLYGADRELAARDGPLAAALATLGVGRAELNAILDGRSDAEMKAAAEALLGRVSAEAFAAATKVVESVLGLATAEAARLVTEALGEHVSKRKPPGPEAPLADAVAYALRFYYDAFEAYDLLLFPLEYGTQLGETNPVEIIRISPRDANRRSEVPAEARALRGASIGHFGAFFDLARDHRARVLRRGAARLDRHRPGPAAPLRPAGVPRKARDADGARPGGRGDGRGGRRNPRPRRRWSGAQDRNGVVGPPGGDAAEPGRPARGGEGLPRAVPLARVPAPRPLLGRARRDRDRADRRRPVDTRRRRSPGGHLPLLRRGGGRGCVARGREGAQGDREPRRALRLRRLALRGGAAAAGEGRRGARTR